MANCCPCRLIRQADFYGIVPLPEIVEGNIINIAISNSQKKYIEPLFCEGILDDLCVAIADENLSTLQDELLCKIKDVHVRYAFADFLFLQPVQVTKESVVRKVSDESEFVDFTTIEKHSNYWKGEALNYVEDLKDFIKENFEDTTCDDTCEDSTDNDWGIY